MRCRNCLTEFPQNNENQRVLYCSKQCRKDFRSPKSKGLAK
jgi:hypothetical protein